MGEETECNQKGINIQFEEEWKVCKVRARSFPTDTGNQLDSIIPLKIS